MDEFRTMNWKDVENEMKYLFIALPHLAGSTQTYKPLSFGI